MENKTAWLDAKALYEFIGTFFLVLTVGMTVLSPHDAGNLAPLAIGSVLAVMVYAGGSISGGHYNPAVSFAVFLRGKLATAELIKYWVVQLLAGAAAGYTTLFFKGVQGQAITFTILPAFIAEFLFTFALCYVVLNTATSVKTAGNSYFGFAIGFTVLAGAYAVGTISGGAFNPAVALGITLLHLNIWANLWVYVAASLAGAALAAVIFKAAHPQE